MANRGRTNKRTIKNVIGQIQNLGGSGIDMKYNQPNPAGEEKLRHYVGPADATENGRGVIIQYGIVPIGNILRIQLDPLSNLD